MPVPHLERAGTGSGWTFDGWYSGCEFGRGREFRDEDRLKIAQPARLRSALEPHLRKVRKDRENGFGGAGRTGCADPSKPFDAALSKAMA